MTALVQTGTSLPLLRRALQPDEWPESYLASLVRDNGVRQPWIYHLDQIRGALPWYQVDGRPTDCLDRHTMPQARDGWPRYGRLALPRWACVHRSAVIRYCPLCMVERRYVRMRWRLSGLPVCTRHGCYLKTDLAEPALTAGYKREDRLHVFDATNEELQAEAVCCMPAEFCVVRAVWEPLEQAAVASGLPYADDELGHLAAWTVLAWRLLEDVARAHAREIRKTNARASLANVAQFIGELQVTISASRAGVESFLHGLRDKVHYKAALRCLRRLLAAMRTESSVLDQLPLGELHDGLVAAAPQLSVVTKSGELVFRQERVRALSRNQAKEMLGVHDKVIDQWIRAGKFRHVETRRIGAKRFIFVGREDVRRVRQYQLSLIYVEDFLIEHGVDWPTYFALRHSQLVAPVQTGDRRYLARRELAGLVGSLELVARPASEMRGPELPLFGQAMVRLAVPQTRYGELIRAALAGRFVIYRSLEHPGLSAFRVGTEALGWLRSRSGRARSKEIDGAAQPQLDFFEASL